jgi:hypothetical protein
MAGDQFTQIANGLFRDGGLSFKAKGLFGLLSTHRQGWRMTVTDLARCARDGDAAVRSGLKELEQHGFLVRERERGQDGTLGAAVYCITDLPTLQNRRSQPESGFPPVDKPTVVNRPTKKTKRKKTNKQKTRPLRPCDRAASSRGSSGTARQDAAASASGADSTPAAPSASDVPPATPPVPAADAMHPGIRLLLEIGAARPELLLTGKALTDQGRVVTVMLESGWTRAQLRHVIADRPLPTPVRTSVGAIIAARLRAAQAYPPPATLTSSHHLGDVLDDVLGDEPPAHRATERPSTAPAARTVAPRRWALHHLRHDLHRPDGRKYAMSSRTPPASGTTPGLRAFRQQLRRWEREQARALRGGHVSSALGARGAASLGIRFSGVTSWAVGFWPCWRPSFSMSVRRSPVTTATGHRGLTGWGFPAILCRPWSVLSWPRARTTPMPCAWCGRVSMSLPSTGPVKPPNAVRL